MRDPNTAAFILVDGHVHVHPCFANDDFLDAASRNFRRAARDLGRTAPFSGCLLLTEVWGAGWFRRQREAGEGRGRWSFLATGEESSLLASNPADERLFLIAGRQIATREGLEVLALGRDLDVPDGLPLDEVLDRVRESGALPVLPWGFGKWWGRRGERVDAALRERLREQEPLELFLGDNAGRLGVAGLPRLLREGGVPVLPGSDPLPFSRHAGRAGSYGFVLEGALDECRPAESLLARIRGLDGPPRVFGRCAGPFEFLRDQAAMQWRRRSAASSRAVTVS